MVVIDPFSLGIAAASAGLGFFGDKAKSDQALRSRNQQIRIQNRQARVATQLQNQQIRDRNRYAAEEFAKRKQLAQQQIGFNRDAANQAYMAENLRLQDQLTQAAFQRSGMQRQLLEAAGYNAAMNEGNRGRSFERASAMGTYGDFGRSMAQMGASLQSMRGQSASNIRRLNQQHRQADFNAYSQVAIAPYMQRELPPAFQMPTQKSSGFNTALQIGQSLLGGVSTYASLAAPAAGNIGGGQQFGTDSSIAGPSFGASNFTKFEPGAFTYGQSSGLTSIGSGGFSNPGYFKPL
jgi:hypothetical protein